IGIDNPRARQIAQEAGKSGFAGGNAAGDPDYAGFGHHTRQKKAGIGDKGSDVVYKGKIRRPMQASAATEEKEDRNKLVVTRFIEELWNQRKVKLADELHAPTCVVLNLQM